MAAVGRFDPVFKKDVQPAIVLPAGIHIHPFQYHPMLEKKHSTLNEILNRRNGCRVHGIKNHGPYPAAELRMHHPLPGCGKQQKLKALLDILILGHHGNGLPAPVEPRGETPTTTQEITVFSHDLKSPCTGVNSKGLRSPGPAGKGLETQGYENPASRPGPPRHMPSWECTLLQRWPLNPLMFC